MSSFLGIVLIGFGLICDFVGCLGLIRLPDVYNRLQASTKCVTFGSCSILLGAFLILGFTTAGIKCLLALLFLLFTSPTSSHAIAQAAYKTGLKLWEKIT